MPFMLFNEYENFDGGVGEMRRNSFTHNRTLRNDERCLSHCVCVCVHAGRRGNEHAFCIHSLSLSIFHRICGENYTRTQMHISYFFTLQYIIYNDPTNWPNNETIFTPHTHTRTIYTIHLSLPPTFADVLIVYLLSRWLQCITIVTGLRAPWAHNVVPWYSNNIIYTTDLVLVPWASCSMFSLQVVSTPNKCGMFRMWNHANLVPTRFSLSFQMEANRLHSAQ